MRRTIAGTVFVSLASLTPFAWSQQPSQFHGTNTPPALTQAAPTAKSAVALGPPLAVRLGAPAPLFNPPGDIAPVSFRSDPDGSLAADRPLPRTRPLGAGEQSQPIAGTSGKSELSRTGFAMDAAPQPIPAPGGEWSLIPEPANWGDEAIAPPGPASSGPYRFYASGEYLLWWIKDSRFPPLVTTSSPESEGVLGEPDTVVLFGDNVDNESRPGGRFTLGFALPWCKPTAIESTFFFLGARDLHFSANSNAYPVLARPFYNINQGIESSELTTTPGVAVGSIDVATSSRLWGAELNFRRNLCCGCWYSANWLLGFRFLDLNEGLRIVENVQLISDDILPAGTQGVVVDSFSTRNRFYGGQLGLASRFGYGNWSLDWWGKVGFGATIQTLNVQGNQVITSPGGGVNNFTGGLLALPSNIGNFTRDQFAIVPEIGVNVGWHPTSHLRLFVGYNFLYWSNVLRPGDQIDRVLDITQIPNFNTNGTNPSPQLRPVVPFKDVGFWAQGATFGLELKY